MDTRRLARPAIGSSRVRMQLVCALGIGIAPLPAFAQYMALTVPPRPDTPSAISPEPRKPVPPAARSADRAFDGHLPNQRTGVGRQRVVRDICIGCDR